jgi:anti-sigma-K factor RskA
LELKDIISSGLLELYAAGLTAAEETQQVEQWIKQYPEAAAELKAIELGLEEYAMASAVAPRADVKQKIFAAINDAPAAAIASNDFNRASPAKVVSLKNYWKWMAAASVALLMGSIVMNVTYFKKYDAANKDLQQTQQQLAIEQQRASDMKTDMEVVHSPFSIPVALKGMETMPEATAKIFWMTNTGEVMVDASNLPDAPQGMQYQFWAIVDGTPVNGGMIITNDKGKKFRMQPMKSFGKAQAFAISLEKEGGNPTPTKVVSMGKTI